VAKKFQFLSQPGAPSEQLSSQLQEPEAQFQRGNVLTITGGHFVHDTFSAFLSPLLPLIIEKLSLSLTLAGTLSAVIQLPSILNPLIGYLDEKINLRKLLFFAPAITATLISAMGLAPNYPSLVFILFLAGMSSALYHALAPALMARISGGKVGMGMSFFMAGGEAGRTLGPLVAVSLVSLLTLEGILPVALVGWAISLILYLRFQHTSLQPVRSFGFQAIAPDIKGFFLPVFLVSLSRSFIITSLGVYLPTLLESEGANLWAAGSSLAVYQFAGVIGALSSGTLSDRLGRRRVLFSTMLLSSLLLFFFLKLQGWSTILVLVLLGFLTLSFQPVMLALIQDHFPRSRSVANGLYMALNFVSLSFASIVIGILGDHFGLRGAFFWSAVISLLSLPMLLVIPQKPIVPDPKA
jgi:FSR family fosmidomycin resistance protein-like MFS transporter